MLVLRHLVRHIWTYFRNGSSCPGKYSKSLVPKVPGGELKLHMKMKIPLLCFKLLRSSWRFPCFWVRELHTQIVAVSFAVLSVLFSSFIVAHSLVSISLCVICSVFPFFHWPCGVCQRSLFAMALKRWAVRQISGLLSDYLEGITEQNLQAGNGGMVEWWGGCGT